MVIGTQQINCLVKLSCHQFIIMISNVRYNISRNAIGTYQNEILVRAEFRCLEPNGSILFIGIDTCSQFLYNTLYTAVLMQTAFPEPVIIDNAVLLQISFQTSNVLRQRKCNQRIPTLFGIAMHITIAIFCCKCLCMCNNICPLIGIFRHLNAFLELL